jgi:hypothetical protein
MVSRYYIFIILASCWFTLAACSGKTKQETAIENDSISGTLLNDSLIFGACSYIFTMENNLFISNHLPVEDCAYRVVDLEKNQFIDKFGFFGSGPGEFFCQEFAGRAQDNDTIYTYDTFRRIQVLSRKEKTTTYQYAYTLPVKTKDDSHFINVRRLDNGYYVGVPISGKSPFFILLDSTGKEAGRFGKIPVIGECNEVIDYFMKLRGVLETSGNSVYYGTEQFGYLARYDINDKGEATLVWEQYLSEPQYRMEDGRIKTNRDKNLEGFYGITTVGDYVLATYSGKLYSSPFAEDPDANLPQTLIIFRKEDGKILRRLHLDRRGTLLTATEDGKTLIMNTYNPEVTYCLYDLEKILKNLN